MDLSGLKRLSWTSQHLESLQDMSTGAWGSKWAAISLWLTPSWGLLQREIVTGHEPGAPVSLTRGINGHCVLPLQMRKMTWWEGICLVQNHKSHGAEKAERNVASEGAISHSEDAGARPWLTKAWDAAPQLLSIRGPVYLFIFFMRHGQWVTVQKAKAAF